MRSIDIKGLAVFDIASGCEIGKVTELLINAEKNLFNIWLSTFPTGITGPTLFLLP
jgi:sporulation protein YlmC with PRC-barrel domain